MSKEQTTSELVRDIETFMSVRERTNAEAMQVLEIASRFEDIEDSSITNASMALWRLLIAHRNRTIELIETTKDQIADRAEKNSLRIAELEKTMKDLGIE